MRAMRSSLIHLFIPACIIALISLPITFGGCAMDVPEKGYDYLTPPLITDIYQDGDYIIVEFIGYNEEYYFDGYNVYVEAISLNRDQINSYKPVQVTESGYASADPSYPLSPDDYDPTLIRRITLYHYYIQNEGRYEKSPFSEGAYFVLLCSHHRLGYLYPEAVSNQVSVDFQ